jgi:hypothetical protein
MPTLEAHGADVYEKNHTPVSLATGIYSRIELFINRHPNPPRQVTKLNKGFLVNTKTYIQNEN